MLENRGSEGVQDAWGERRLAAFCIVDFGRGERRELLATWLGAQMFEVITAPLAPQRGGVDSESLGSLLERGRVGEHLFDAAALELLERERVRLTGSGRCCG